MASGIWPILKKRLANVFQPRTGDAARGTLARLGDALYDMGIIGYSREFEAVHQALIGTGLAVPLGAPFPAAASGVPDDLPRVVERIRALFNPG
jgi:hypothetical protein